MICRFNDNAKFSLFLRNINESIVLGVQERAKIDYQFLKEIDYLIYKSFMHLLWIPCHTVYRAFYLIFEESFNPNKAYNP